VTFFASGFAAVVAVVGNGGSGQSWSLALRLKESGK